MESNRAKALIGSRSQCEPFREQIIAKLDRGLSAQRIFQDLVEEHGFTAKYHSVHRQIQQRIEEYYSGLVERLPAEKTEPTVVTCPDCGGPMRLLEVVPPKTLPAYDDSG